jgi:chromosome segregation ATPase
METNNGDQHLIDELYNLNTQLSDYKTKYNEQCKRIDDLNTVIADKEERIKELEKVTAQAIDEMEFLLTQVPTGSYRASTTIRDCKKALNP